ncbi:MAG TPA: hypothetical protein PLA06_07755 [Syntrophorhabdaceae bacterium]|nr:hypothetical protein [Syntrophorhabdaceae bacterium]HQP52057.1 hypothetical protein [Syntrophorhabdaceae bacterium]
MEGWLNIRKAKDSRIRKSEGFKESRSRGFEDSSGSLGIFFKTQKRRILLTLLIICFQS